MSTDDLMPLSEASSREIPTQEDCNIDQQTARQERIASDAPQAWFQSDPNHAPIFIARENGVHADHGTSGQAPEQIDPLSPLYTVVNRFPSASNELSTENVTSSTDEDSAPRIWGMKKTTVLKVAILLILIASAAIAGGVGGSIAIRKNKANNKSAPISSNTTNLPSNTTRAITMPFNLQIWATGNFTGRSKIFYTSGYFNTSFPAKSYRWSPGKWNDTMRLCTMSFCHGDHQIAWYGASKHESSSFSSSWYGWEYGNSVNIDCGNDFEDPGCPSTTSSYLFQTAPVIETTVTPTPTQIDITSSTSVRSKPATPTTKVPLNRG